MDKIKTFSDREKKSIGPRDLSYQESTEIYMSKKNIILRR